MNRRTGDNMGRGVLVKQLQKFTYEDLVTFSPAQLQSVVLGLFGRKSREYAGSLDIQNPHRLSHLICDECNIEYPGRYRVEDTIKMLKFKLKTKGKAWIKAVEDELKTK